MRRAAAAAFAWEFRRRLGGALTVLAVYLVVLSAVQLLAPVPPIRPGRSLLFAFTVLIPLTGAGFYLVAVFSYGLSGDLAGRASMYPARLFTLPVTTAELAGYPMLFGSLALASLYVVANLAALRPAGVSLPLVWPAVFLAVFSAWMQVFTWTPYGLAGVRPAVAVLALFSLDAAAIVGYDRRPPELLMAGLLAPLLPLAYVAARSAVGRARRGEVPDWGVRLARRSGTAASGFLSARRAQLWYEWRQHGRSLPGWVAVVLPFHLLLLHAVRHEPRVLTVVALVALLLTPPFLAAFVAATVSRSGAGADAYGLSPFQATRPVTTGFLLGAKLAMALASTLAAWVVALAGLALGVAVSGGGPWLRAWLDGALPYVGIPRMAVAGGVLAGALLLATWKQLVQGLCIGLTGREGLIKGSVLLRLSLLVLLGLALHVLHADRGARALVWEGVPWILGGLVLLKTAAAASVAARLSRARLLPGRARIGAAAAWVAAVLALGLLLAWLLDTPLVPRYLLLLLAILAVPVVRPAAAALALVSNRHRGAPPASPAAARGLAGVVALLALPATLALGQAVAYHRHHRNNGTLVSSGVPREYLLYVPRSHDPGRPAPLVISMHGGALWPSAQRDVSRWNEVADEHGFLVVYPAGFSRGGPRAWRMGHPDETRFLADLVDHLQARWSIDPRRIYADGLSNGGGMAFVLSCTLSDRIAAVGMVGSAQLLPWSWCTDTRPVPMVAFHGTEDRYTPYHGGKTFVARQHFPAIPTWTTYWARRNRCAETPTDTRVADDVTRRAYGGCAAGADVVLYTVHGGGHTWPGGGPMPEWFAGRTSTGIHASRESWAFFQAHPLVPR